MFDRMWVSNKTTLQIWVVQYEAEVGSRWLCWCCDSILCKCTKHL